jgi:hypothetical protein
LCRLKPTLFETYGQREGLSSDQVQTVHEDDEGALWIGTNGDGLDRMKDGKVERFGLPQGLSNLWSVLRDRGGVVWRAPLDCSSGSMTVRPCLDDANIGRSVTALMKTPGALGGTDLGGLAYWRDGHAPPVPGPRGRDVRVEDSKALGRNNGDGSPAQDGQFTRFGIARG